MKFVPLYFVCNKLELVITCGGFLESTNDMSMAECKRNVTPLLMQWSYVSFALSHWYNLFCSDDTRLFFVGKEVFVFIIASFYIFSDKYISDFSSYLFDSLHNIDIWHMLMQLTCQVGMVIYNRLTRLDNSEDTEKTNKKPIYIEHTLLSFPYPCG